MYGHCGDFAIIAISIRVFIFAPEPRIHLKSAARNIGLTLPT